MGQDVDTMLDRLESWKFYAVLQGTFFRFHSWTSAILRHTLWRRRADSHLIDVLTQMVDSRLEAHVREYDQASCHTGAMSTAKRSASNMLGESISSLQGREDNDKHAFLGVSVAAALVHSDPIARHMLSTLFYLSRHPKELQELRYELDAQLVPFSDPPLLWELIDREDNLPRLYAIMAESRRLQPCDAFDFTRQTPPGVSGTMIAGFRIPQEVVFPGRKVPMSC